AQVLLVAGQFACDVACKSALELVDVVGMDQGAPGGTVKHEAVLRGEAEHVGPAPVHAVLAARELQLPACGACRLDHVAQIVMLEVDLLGQTTRLLVGAHELVMALRDACQQQQDGHHGQAEDKEPELVAHQDIAPGEAWRAVERRQAQRA
ncbi:hypothetical protein RZS08_19535, partial [Arthrospira platensis SPKY1]|nr:hypothetical protein [Arthrospira platensis SPKY1]